MTTEKKKKNKSVERVKNNTTVMNDSNLNNQSVQIIFPSDTEIRKVKKKPKRKTGKSKSEKEKDELLEQLKEDLKTYDSVQQEAVEKKVKIPQELGVSTITKADLKKNDDIKLFISDVVNKTQKMRELIAAAEQKLSQPSRSFPLRLGGGINRFANLPAVIPQQQEIIQPQIIPPTPIPSQTPQKIPTAPKSDEKLEALKKIAEETKEQLEKSGVDVPIQPPTDPSTTADEDPKSPITPGSLLPQGDKPVIRPPKPAVPPIKNIPTEPVAPDEPQPQSPQPPPVDTSGYESNTLKNGETVIAPPGWYDIYNKFQFNLKNLQFITQQNQKLPGVYHIPLTRYNDFKLSQTNILNEYSKYFESLRPQDRKYILTEPMVKAVDTAMKNDFKKEPKDLMIELFTEQKIPFKEITQGDEVPELETAIQQQGLKDDEKQKALELFEKKLADETNALIRLRSKIQNLNGDQVGESLREVNKTEEDIIVEYDKLDPIVKLGVEDGKEKLLVRINETKSLLGQRLVMLPNSNDVPKLKEYLNDESKIFTTAGVNSIYAIVLRLFGKVFADSVALENATNKKKRISRELKKYEDKQPVADQPTGAPT
jgi:hypothetical protein